MQIGGDHYRKYKIQPWDIIDEYNMNFYEGNVIKYLLRWKDKDGVADLQKAKHYLEKLIEQQTKSKPPKTLGEYLTQKLSGESAPSYYVGTAEQWSDVDRK